MPSLVIPFSSGTSEGSLPSVLPTGVKLVYNNGSDIVDWSTGQPTTDLDMVVDLDNAFSGVAATTLRQQIRDYYIDNSNVSTCFYSLKQMVDSHLTGVDKTNFEAYNSLIQSLIPGPIATGLHWPKVYSGSMLTWSLDVAASNLPFTETQIFDKSLEQFNKIEQVCNVKFNYLTGGASSDIRIMFENVDGPGGTLGFVFQPSTGNSMQACGVCGPVHMDQDDNFSLTDYGNVLLHELGHSVGLSHTSDIGVPAGSNVMDPFYSFGSPEFQWGVSDIFELTSRYVYF